MAHAWEKRFAELQDCRIAGLQNCTSTEKARCIQPAHYIQLGHLSSAGGGRGGRAGGGRGSNVKGTPADGTAQVLVMHEGPAGAPSKCLPAHALDRAGEAGGGSAMVNLTYDPMLNCYYDPSTQQYYEV
eukprot:916984-Pelagomonas_calceolata.AAC.2